MEFTKVKDWMIDLLVFIEPDKSVHEALSLMRRRYIHSLLVSKTSEYPEYGIVTSTDVCDKIIAENRHPGETRVREIMTSPIITVNENMSLQECSRIMQKHHIHHVPVVNNADELVGMISATDFLVAAEAMGRAPGEHIQG